MKVMLIGALTVASLLVSNGPAVTGVMVEAAQPAQVVSTCQNTQLTIRAQSSQGAAGHIAVIYRLHNLSGRACTLFGYPGIQLLDRRFLSLPTTVHRGAGYIVGPIPKRLVHIGPHGNAYFALGYSDVPVGNRGCQATAAYLMIIPPNDFLPVVTYAFTNRGGISACTGNLDVSPVTSQPRYR